MEVNAGSFDDNSEPATVNDTIIRDLKASIDVCEQEISELNKTKGLLTDQASFLKEYIQQRMDTTSSKEPLKIADMKQLLEFYNSSMDECQSSLLMLSKNLDGKNKELSRLREQLSFRENGNGRGTPQHRKAVILLDVAEVGVAVELTIVYVVTKAAWIPSYDIRFNSMDNTMVLTYYVRCHVLSGVPGV